MMVDITTYVKDIEKYSKAVNKGAVQGLGRSLAGAMARNDARTVAAGDKAELARVRRNFVAKKLGVKDKAKGDAAIAFVCEQMKKSRAKSRVTFYYLLAKKLGKLGALK